MPPLKKLVQVSCLLRPVKIAQPYVDNGRGKRIPAVARNRYGLIDPAKILTVKFDAFHSTIIIV
jgi:hypothetical protein